MIISRCLGVPEFNYVAPYRMPHTHTPQQILNSCDSVAFIIAKYELCMCVLSSSTSPYLQSHSNIFLPRVVTLALHADASMATIIAGLFHAIDDGISALSRSRLVESAGEHKYVLVVVVFTFAEASRWGNIVQQGVDDQRDDEACDEAQSRELHQVVGRAVDVGAREDVAWEGGSDGEDEGEEGAPVVSVGLLSAFFIFLSP